MQIESRPRQVFERKFIDVRKEGMLLLDQKPTGPVSCSSGLKFVFGRLDSRGIAAGSPKLVLGDSG